MNKEIEILEYIRKGNIGCTFASVAAKMKLDGNDMDWQFVHINNITDKLSNHKLNKSTISILFPEEWKIPKVREWLTINGFEEEIIKKGSWFRKAKRFLKNQKLVGVRYKQKENNSWVMYFGQDSHCPTRKTPYPMVTFRIKKPKDPFYKVGFKNNILHIAQMSVFLFNVSKNKLEKLWQTSHANSRKIIGKEKLNEEHAAKTTFKI